MTIPDFETQEDSQLHQEIHDIINKRDGQLAEWMIHHYNDHVRLRQMAWVIGIMVFIAAVGGVVTIVKLF